MFPGLGWRSRLGEPPDLEVEFSHPSPSKLPLPLFRGVCLPFSTPPSQVQLKSYLAKKERGDLRIDRFQRRMAVALTDVALSEAPADGALRFGHVVMLSNPSSETALATDLGEPETFLQVRAGRPHLLLLLLLLLLLRDAAARPPLAAARGRRKGSARAASRRRPNAQPPSLSLPPPFRLLSSASPGGAPGVLLPRQLIPHQLALRSQHLRAREGAPAEGPQELGLRPRV